MTLALVGAGLLLAALAATMASAAAALAAGRRADPRLAALGRRAFYAGAAATAAAAAVLLAALLGHDFTIAYVTEHTDRSLPWPLVAAAFYGGQEGSLLYWALLLALIGSASLAAAPRLGVRLGAYANGVLAAVAAFFLFVLVFVASPFDLLAVTPADGLGLNPLLRDGGMLIHPPFLLAGFSSFAVPFAFAAAALLTGRPDAAWMAYTRRFALLAWGLQSTGLVLGMWWAYHVLGWGGYWGWDPVEDVALMPWLVTTAYLHVSLAQERRRSRPGLGSFGLVIAAFLLAIFGTFVTRSGILPSVHSFAVSPLGPWFFGFLAACVLFSCALLALRWAPPPRPCPEEGGIRPTPTPRNLAISRGPRDAAAGPSPAAPARKGEGLLPASPGGPGTGGGTALETAFRIQNALLVTLTAAVLWGVTLPLLSGMVGRELVVGPAYYERVSAPLFVLLLALLAAGPLLPWTRSRRAREAALRRMRWPVAGALLTLAVLLAAGVGQPGALVAFPLLGAGLATCLAEYVRAGLRAHRLPVPWPLAAARVLRRRRRRYGAFLAHAGILLVAAGVAGSHLWQQSRQVQLRPGQSVTVAGHTLTYESSVQRSVGDHAQLTAYLRMGDEPLEPARLTYPSLGGQAVSQVAIRSTPVDDVYVVLVGSGNGAVALNVFVNPLVSWIWCGAALLVLGVLVGHLGRAEPAPAPSPLPASAGATPVGRLGSSHALR